MASSLTPDDLRIPELGAPRFPSPLRLSTTVGDGLGDFVSEDRRVRFEVEITMGAPEAGDDLLFERTGPRERLYFDPATTRAAVVTCGGLCPGINNVIHSLFFELTRNYGVPEVLGIRHGYRGLNPACGLEPQRLTESGVEEIHKLGGTVLGTSRGPQDSAVAADFLVDRGIDVLFCVGGDGTQRGAYAIFEEVTRRGLPISIVGIPKTIDNDIPFVDRTFGYLTALDESQQALRAASVEARSVENGVALVKLMGRNAGFIAVGAALASQEVDFVLVPEVAFPLTGEHGFLAALEAEVRRRSHAVIVVAEGAGLHLMGEEGMTRDPSGNRKQADIGLFLKEHIGAHLKAAGLPFSLKYIDPSYLIRSVPANCADRLLCDRLARDAAHAAMAGKTNVLIGLSHEAFIHVPISTAVRDTKTLDIEGDRFTSVLLSTGQPRWGVHGAAASLQ
jgi:6-phosphofructokinase 1